MSSSSSSTTTSRRGSDVLTRLDSLLQREDSDFEVRRGAPAIAKSETAITSKMAGRKSNNSPPRNGSSSSSSKIANGTEVVSPSSSTYSPSPTTAKTNSVSHKRKPSGILKKIVSSGGKNGRNKSKRSIRFPVDSEEMQEIIGYGGDEELLSDDDDDEEEVMLSVSSRLKQLQKRSNSNKQQEMPEQITVEERNMINLTKKNTDFNSRSANFMVDANGDVVGTGGQLKLGATKGSGAPLVTVSPFGGPSTGGKTAPGKVNKVSPMINGQLLVKKVEAEFSKTNNKSDSKKASDMQEVAIASDQNNKADSNKEVITTRFGSDEENKRSSGGIGGSSGDKKEVDKIEEATPSHLSSSSRIQEAVGSDRSTLKTEGEEDEIETDDDDDEAPSMKIGSGKVEGESTPPLDRPHVKLTRKSPYVTSSILKGTPKPVIKVKTKPPIPANKPKLPEKPRNIKLTPVATSTPKSHPNWGKNPVATPRRGSFRGEESKKGNLSPDNNNKAGEVRISSGVDGSSTIDLSKLRNGGVPLAESYNSEADAQNEVIFEVNATMVTNHEKLLAGKSERDEVLGKIRKSLESNQEEIQANGGNKSAVGFSSNLPCRSSSTKRQAPKPPPQSCSNGVAKNNSQCEDDKTGKPDEKQRGGTGGQQPQRGSSLSPSSPSLSSTAGKMTRHSSLRPGSGAGDRSKGEGSGHRVQFSLEHEDLEETRRRKVKEAAEATDPNPISYNQWITRGALNGVVARQPVNGIVESSFTGQPIQVMPTQQQQQQQQQPPQNGSDAKPASPTTTPVKVPPAVVPGPPKVIPLPQKPMSPADDEVRRWTEKKRSKSQQPRGSEIEELRGSSKTKPKSRFFPAVPLPQLSSSSSNNGIKRHSRVELYEADRKQKNNAGSGSGGGKFSFGKIIRQLAQTSQRIGGSHSELYSKSNGFLDEEHEREIIERDRSKQHLAGLGLGRPSIVHPVELNGAVEVVPIRPHAGNRSGHFAKNKAPGLRKGAAPVIVAANVSSNSNISHNHSQMSSLSPPPTTVATKSILKARVEYSDSKDSGHETSSIHTDNSDENSSNHGSSSVTSSEHYMAAEHGQLANFEQEQQQLQRHQQQSSQLRPQPNLNGKVKPPPPPRSSSNSCSNSSSCGSDSGNSNSDRASESPTALTSQPQQQLASINKFHPSNPVATGVVVPPGPPSPATSSSSGPPSGYVLAGQMNLGGAIRVPAFNSANLRTATSRLFAKEQGEEDEGKKHSAQPPHVTPTPFKPEEEVIQPPPGDTPSSSYSNGEEKAGGGNYDTVTSANLEVLTQILAESSRDGGEEARVVLDALRDLKRDLKLEDFEVEETRIGGEGRNAIKNALFIGHDSVRVPVTLAILTGSKMEEEEESPLSLWRVALPLACFRDECVGVGNGDVTVFPRLSCLSRLGDRRSTDGEDVEKMALTHKDAAQVILQLLKGERGARKGKNMTSRRKSMDDYVLIRERAGGAHVLAQFQNRVRADNDAGNEGEEEELSSLALSAMTRLTGHSNPEEMLAKSRGDAKELVKMMMTEREEESLVAALEVWLWGPPLPSSLSEPLAQRWLDLERARALNEVLRKGGGLGKVRLTVSEEMRMAFLIGAKAGEVSKISARLKGDEEGMNL